MAVFSILMESSSMGRQISVLFASPEAGMSSSTKVVFLLHGGGGGKGLDNTCWLKDGTPLQDYANQYNSLFVMPSAPDSMYANSVEGENYEDLIARELPAFVRSHFRVSCKREETVAAGMSMGGYGAMRIGLCEPETFGVIICLSAGNLCVSDLSNTVHAWAVEHVFGVDRIEQTAGTEHDLFSLAKRDIEEHRPLPRIYQEAAYLFANMQQLDLVNRIPFDESVKQSYQAFMSQMSQYQGLPAGQVHRALYPQFGNTYYYEYFFLKDITYY